MAKKEAAVEQTTQQPGVEQGQAPGFAIEQKFLPQTMTIQLQSLILNQ